MIPILLIAFGVTGAVLQPSLFPSPQKTPYAKLFGAQPELARQLAARIVAAQPRTVCGMTLIPIDPNFDPRIRIVAPSTPEHKLRAIRPPVCVD